ncbi:toxin [Nocardia uniformis]|uniref:Toxin n=1 Tax=Nocardia uniformis TaxID=53432 RepID=A0A849C7R0_9NOCA|nr:toxin [Nocardia uniformis]NNH72345.1 toxin [Nocardia uniformis]
MQQGEIRPRRDAGPPTSYVVVLSGPRYLSAGKGRVVVCRIVPGVVPDDFTSVHRVRYRDPDGTETIGVAVPDLVHWIPESGLGEPVGTVSDLPALVNLVGALFR